MRRMTTMLAGAAAAALLPLGAFAQAIDASTTQFTTGGVIVTAPVNGNIEFAGANTSSVDIEVAGLTATDDALIDVVVFLRNADGDVRILQVFEDVNNGGDTVDGAGELSATIDFSSIVGFASALNLAVDSVGVIQVPSGSGIFSVAAGIGIVVNDTGDGVPANIVGADTLLDIDDEDNDEIIDIDNDGPELAQVLLDTENDRLVLIFSEPIIATLGNLTNADFEFSDTGDDNDFTALSALAFPGNPTGIATSGGTALAFAIDPANADLAPQVGDFVRLADASNPDILDLAENEAVGGEEGAQVGGVTTPMILSACFVETVGLGDTVADAIKVTFTVALSDSGNLDFWDNIALSGGGMTDLTVTGVTLDPNDPTSVLLEVTSGGLDGVAGDGLGIGDADNESFELSVDADAIGVDAPIDILGTEFDGAVSVDLDDCIVPEVDSDFFTLDFNGDGIVDGIGVCFTEPMSLMGIDEGGFTITRLDSTLHPIALFLANLDNGIDNPYDDENEVAIEATGDDDDDASDIITGFSLMSDDDDDRLTTNNCLVININAALFDWDGDGELGNDLPGTLDLEFAEIEVLAEEAGLTDASGNSIDTDFSDGVDIDMAAPVAVRVEFSTGDNVAGGDQLPFEQDGEVGDSNTNNIAFVIFNELLFDNGIDETRFRFGTGADERFQDGDFLGIVGDGENILVFEDSTGGGFMPGDIFNIATDNGLVDDFGNEYVSSNLSGAPDLDVIDASAPYVLLQTDINGNTIHSAFLGGVDEDGFATTVTLTFSQEIKEGTEGTVDDWEVEGVDEITSVELIGGNVIRLTFPSDLIAAENEVTVTYLGGDIDDATMRISAASGAMASVDQVDANIIARLVPEADVDGEFMAVMDIGGTIASGAAGTKVFGAISVPRAHAARMTMGGVTVTIDDQYSMQAITNVLLGLKTDVYLLFDGDEMWFANDKNDDDAEGAIRLNLNFTNLANVTFTGTGSFFTGVTTSVSGGTVTICWDVLRSDTGTAWDLYANGYDIGGLPIVSSTVVTGDDGEYLLHMTAPISAFNSTLNAIGWPVIIVVELPNGERYAVSSMLNAIDGLGPITFQALQRQTNPFDSDANIIFNIDLDRVGMQSLWGGWNSLPFDRASGWQRTANSILLPAGVSSSNVQTGTTLANVNPLDQFVFFYDANEDGVWTAADDDDGRLDSIVVGSRCLDFFVFVMDSNGVRTGNNFNAFTGGYAAGVFNGVEWDADPVRIGVFQFGEPINASTVFSANTGTGSFPDNATTMGWAFVTSPVSSDNLANFLQMNASDFIIIFNRTSHSSVGIRTFSAGTGDAEEIEAGQALFLHK